MSGPLKLGFMPLDDAAGLIVAKALGFFADEGLDVELSREASWATIRDKVAVGALDGAHMLAPMVLAQSLGIGSEATAMIAPLALATDGAAITLSARLGLGPSPTGVGLADLVAQRRDMDASLLTFGVVFPFSTHNYLLRLWVAQAGLDPDRDVRIVVAPPPRMAGLLAGGVIEGFCVGEPWNAVAVNAGAGVVAARGAAIAPGAPDKVFGVTRAWAQANPVVLQALLRALLRALAWADSPENREALATLLAEPQHVGVASDAIAAGLKHVVFHRGGVTRPDPAQAMWLLDQMRRWGQIAPGADVEAALSVYAPQMHDQAAVLA
ncbi:CmpA/NrtA family ABC transporter substrate-binding protein [Phenylobacterium sp. Root700]|uniref:CmpA/NrtA family ABC transporter substrate-binding protein n=1 Tax=Phenylobacterium sp. Root700 TaxID=1736591 RepID=UPI0006F245EC|nr:CmpA/NrtA family ABC transporter substrate-binding protein [Phenylobacterium sp. Root700]KRB41013.1 thiamine biosynthesis protein [Phenylobacterium sp. Root700]